MFKSGDLTSLRWTASGDARALAVGASEAMRSLQAGESIASESWWHLCQICSIMGMFLRRSTRGRYVCSLGFKNFTRATVRQKNAVHITIHASTTLCMKLHVVHDLGILSTIRRWHQLFHSPFLIISPPWSMTKWHKRSLHRHPKGYYCYTDQFLLLSQTSPLFQRRAY